MNTEYKRLRETSEFNLARKMRFMSYKHRLWKQASEVVDIKNRPIYAMADLKTCCYCEFRANCIKVFELDALYFKAMLKSTQDWVTNIKNIYCCSAFQLSEQWQINNNNNIVIRAKRPQKKKTGQNPKRDFFNSLEWKRLRAKILEEQSGTCQCCGRTYREHGVILHVDHIIPISRDWDRRLDITNLQILCEDCNIGKGNRYKTNWRVIK